MNNKTPTENWDRARKIHRDILQHVYPATTNNSTRIWELKGYEQATHEEKGNTTYLNKNVANYNMQ